LPATKPCKPRRFAYIGARLSIPNSFGIDRYAVSALAISSANHWLATGDSDKTVRLWEPTVKDPARGPALLLAHKYQFKAEKMSREELERILDERTFNPFVLTTMDGFAIPVTDPHKALSGMSMIVIAHTDGLLYQIPFSAIAHISGRGGRIG
jgi:hypothetical protein